GLERDTARRLVGRRQVGIEFGRVGRLGSGSIVMTLACRLFHRGRADERARSGRRDAQRMYGRAGPCACESISFTASLRAAIGRRFCTFEKLAAGSVPQV